MGSIPQELSLDFKTKFIPQTITDFLKKLSTIYNVSERSSKLNDYINSLEDEMRKIDAFKRELPLCMLLLTDAIVFLKDESMMQCNDKPVLEEFIPLKKDDCNDEDEEEEENEDEVEDCKDKKNWMSSVQLWNSDDHSTINYTSKVQIKQVEEEVNRSAVKDPFHSNKDKGEEEKAFIPFRGYPTFLSTVVARREDHRKVLPVPRLSLLTPGIKNFKEESSSGHSKPSCSKAASTPISKVQSNLRTGAQHPQQHTSRKQRRCWSQELHRRFVNALQQLGGSQAATPKQIRELMQVDGLTNDEVKSHLQKYRLHGRRLPTGAPASSTNPSVVVLGGLWTPQDQFSESSKHSNSQSGSPQGPLQLAGNTGGTSTTGDNSMDDDDEDEKSDSYSWRSHIHNPRRRDDV